MQSVLAALIGAAVTAVLGVGLWSLAYFGDIDLHLPQRSTYEFSTVDQYIRDNLPPGYAFTVSDVGNFRGNGSDTLLVSANPGPSQEVQSRTANGIIMLLDKISTGSFEIDYKFEPRFVLRLDDGRIVSATIAVSTANQPDFGTTVLVAQWLPNSNGVSPVFGQVVLDDDGSIVTDPLYTGNRSNHLPGSTRYQYTSLLIKALRGSPWVVQVTLPWDRGRVRRGGSRSPS